MDKKIKINLIIFISFIVASLLFTILLSTVDVRSSINNPRLGFASINENVFYGLGQSKLWYIITQIIGYLAILVMVTFAVIGIIQLIQRKSIKKVDKEIIGLGIIYVLIALIYIFFEKAVVINFRPILEDGELAPSFPSSHTLLACVVFASSFLEAKKLIKVRFINDYIIFFIEFFVIIMVGGRLLSGVHWLSDIVASVLYSGVIVSGYYLAINYLYSKEIE